MSEQAPDQVYSDEQQHDQLSLSRELSERNMFCLHGIAQDILGLNSMLSETTTLVERYRIAIEDRPSLSAVVHTDKATTSKASLWSTVGVVIGDGLIQAASPRDMSSRMLEDGTRKAPVQSTEEVLTALDKIAANDNKYPEDPPHNEIIINNPVIAGLYFKDTAGLMEYQINRQQTVAEPGTIPELVRKLGAAYGLPIFAVRTSGVYEVKEFDSETGKYQFSNETAPRVHASEAIALRQPGHDKLAYGQTLAAIAISREFS